MTAAALLVLAVVMAPVCLILVLLIKWAFGSWGTAFGVVGGGVGGAALIVTAVLLLTPWALAVTA